MLPVSGGYFANPGGYHAPKLFVWLFSNNF